MNGSPLFTGDAGRGESEIRRYILENDLLEALIALPEQLFYNTGIATYVWLLTNRKAPSRAGRTVSRIFPTTWFGFRKIAVERPLRLNFRASDERIARLDDQRAFANLTKSRKRGEAGERDKAEGRALRESIKTALRMMPDTLHKDREAFVAELQGVAKRAEIKLRAPIKRAILIALSERDETAAICRDKKGNPEPDPELRDTERIPLPQGRDPVDEEGIPASVQAFFDREVKPHAPDAWIDTKKRDHRDGRVGLIGYEINFNRYFYRFKPPRALGEIEADIQEVTTDIVRMLGEMAGGASADAGDRPAGG